MNWAAASALLILAIYLRLHEPERPGKPPEAFWVEHSYKSRIVFEDGSIRGAEVLLIRRADTVTYEVIWNVGGPLIWGGVGLQHDGFLSFATNWYPIEHPRTHDILGVAIYRIDGGRLKGMAYEEGKSVRRQFPESLEGPDSLDGRFEIIEGGAARSGYVKLTAKKGAYLFARIGDHPVMTGVGVRIGDALVVSYSTRLNPAVTALCPTGTGLNGLRVDSTLNFNSVALMHASSTDKSAARSNNACRNLLTIMTPVEPGG